MADNIKKRKGETWQKETYYFYCPVCEKPYNVKYDASTRTSFDGKYEKNTCAVKKDKCSCCKTNVYVAYDVELQGMVAYDVAEEKRWDACLQEFNDELEALKKVKRQLKKKASAKLKKQKAAIKKSLEKMEAEIIALDDKYEAMCLEEMISREIEESTKF